MTSKVILLLDLLVPSIELILILILPNFFHFLLWHYQFLIVNFQLNSLNFLLMKLFVLLLGLYFECFHYLFLLKMHPPPHIKNRIAKPSEYFTDLHLLAIDLKVFSTLYRLLLISNSPFIQFIIKFN